MVGAVAQLGEHLLCKQGVSGSIPLSSTIFGPHGERSLWLLPADGAPNDWRRPLACIGGLLKVERGSHTAQSASPIVWRPCGAPAAREHECLLKKNKFAHCKLHVCLFCKYREEKIDLEASRCGFCPCPRPVPKMSLMA